MITRRSSIVAIAAMSALAWLICSQTAFAAPRYPRLTESSPANQLANELNTLGIGRYPTEFAGVTPDAADHITLYAAGSARDLISTAANLNTSQVAITVQLVPRSFSTLDLITKQLAADYHSLESEGIHLQSWGPFPPSDTVRVELESAPAHISTRSYHGLAQDQLDDLFGSSSISVDPQTQPALETTTARDSDAVPFKGGDGLTFPAGNGCTDSWAVKNSSGAVRVLTAGHCRTGNVYTNHDTTFIGSVQSQFVGANYDYETVSANEQPRVWQAGGNSYGVLGYTDPPDNSLMTVNGDVSGEHTGQLVQGQDECVSVTDSFYGSYIVCGMGEASNNSTAICHPGDSGGPAYTRNSTATGVYAAGTIEATSSTGKSCFFESVSWENGHSNLTLETN